MVDDYGLWWMMMNHDDSDDYDWWELHHVLSSAHATGTAVEANLFSLFHSCAHRKPESLICTSQVDRNQLEKVPETIDLCM